MQLTRFVSCVRHSCRIVTLNKKHTCCFLWATMHLTIALHDKLKSFLYYIFAVLLQTYQPHWEEQTKPLCDWWLFNFHYSKRTINPCPLLRRLHCVFFHTYLLISISPRARQLRHAWRCVTKISAKLRHNISQSIRFTVLFSRPSPPSNVSR